MAARRQAAAIGCDRRIGGWHEKEIPASHAEEANVLRLLHFGCRHYKATYRQSQDPTQLGRAFEIPGTRETGGTPPVFYCSRSTQTGTSLRLIAPSLYTLDLDLQVFLDRYIY